jgi:hypothetical protein
MKKRIVLSVCAAFALLFMAVDGPVACGIGTSPSEAAEVASGGADDEPNLAAVVDAGPASGIGTSPSLVDPEKDPGGFASSLLDSAKAGKWRLFAGLLLMAAVWASRRWGSSLWPWLKTDRGGAALVLALGMVGGLATALADGAPLNLALLVNSVSMAVGGAGTYAVLKKLFNPADAK